jgi:hypothetical protein
MQGQEVVEKKVQGEGVVVAQIEPQFLAWLTKELAKRYEVEVNVGKTKTKWVKVPRK